MLGRFGLILQRPTGFLLFWRFRNFTPIVLRDGVPTICTIWRGWGRARISGLGGLGRDRLLPPPGPGAIGSKDCP